MTKNAYTFILFLSLLCNSDSAISGKILQSSDLVYMGAFRVPQGSLGGASVSGETLSRGGYGLTYNSSRNSLVMISGLAEKLVVEISVPTPINNSDVSALNIASLVQAPGNITNGNWLKLKDNGTDITSPEGAIPGGLLVYNSNLIGTAFAYYDNATEAFRSHYKASPNWVSEGTQYGGMYKVGLSPRGESTANGGFVGGYMAVIPAEWQTAFGYPALTGLGGLTIMPRTSYGPGVFGFNPDNLGEQDPVTATFLLGYPEEHTTLGGWSGPGNLYWNKTTEIRGLVFPQGTDSLLFFGRNGYGFNGTGDHCYGEGTSNISLHMTPNQYSMNYCYDPASSYEGSHAYPYYYQVWAYDAKDLVAVKNGQKTAWEVTPYAIWDLNLPYDLNGDKKIVGAAYDATNQKIYVAQFNGDRVGDINTPYPIIHVFNVSISAGQRYRLRSVISNKN